ncbi:CidA/LrgA family protein [Frigidibacter sp. MR17.24]|uniref:CidA/LrgA family protein n=1 Tax=Frigidibacter sp. MR17.24 TaxID=3127345 RepID=UPI00301315DA
MPPLLAAILTIFLFQLGGEVLTRFAHLPIPGPVIGMVAMAAGFVLSPRLLALVRPVAQTLLGHLSLLFVPAGVGIVSQIDVIRQQGVALILALVVSTLLAIAVGAVVFELVARATGNPPPEGAERRK